MKQDEKKHLVENLQSHFNKEDVITYLSLQFDFLSELRQADTIDFITFYDYINFPLPISQKLFTLFSSRIPILTKKAFIKGLSDLYFGSFDDKVNTLVSLFDFEQKDRIYKEHIELLIIHFYCYSNFITLDELLNHFNSTLNLSHNPYTQAEMSIVIKNNPDLYYYFMINFDIRKPFDEINISFYNKHIQMHNKHCGNSINACSLSPIAHCNKKVIKSKSLITNGCKNGHGNDDDYLLSDFLYSYFTNAKSGTGTSTGKGNEDNELMELNTFEKDICSMTKKVESKMTLVTKHSFQEKSNEDISMDKGMMMQHEEIHTDISEITKGSSNNSVCCFKRDSYTNCIIQEFSEPMIGYIYNVIDDSFVRVIIYVVQEDLFAFNCNDNNEEGKLCLFISLKHLFVTRMPIKEIKEDHSNSNHNNTNSYRSHNNNNKIIHPILLKSNNSYRSKQFQIAFTEEHQAEVFIKVIARKTHSLDVNNFYEDIDSISKGGSGDILIVKRKSDNQLYVKKILLKPSNNDHNTLLCFKKEEYIFGLFAHISHPGIAKCYEIYEDENALYIIQEYYPEGNLNKMFNDNYRHLKTSTIEAIMHQLIASIRFLHKYGIVHRDLKLENILISNSQTKIIDFGLSTILGKYEKTRTQCGTLGYLPPEIINNKKYNHSVDLWSLGVILYYLFYGKFHYNTIENINVKLSAKEIINNIINETYAYPEREGPSSHSDKKICNFIQRCLEKDGIKRCEINLNSYKLL